MLRNLMCTYHFEHVMLNCQGFDVEFFVQQVFAI